jgi:hypothetical protein
VGGTRRKLSFFVMVLCYSRLMYLAFTLSQRMEQFLACHLQAFEAFGGRVPARIRVDNLKSAVLRRLTGEAPVFNPRYRDFAEYAGFTITPCNIGKGNEKERVEAAVGYVKKNFLAGLAIPDFSAVNPAARVWLETIANVRVHGETHQRPLDRFAEEQALLHPLPGAPFDCASVYSVRASSRFRVTFETNHYSVPAEYAGRPLTLKVYADRLCRTTRSGSSRATHAATTASRTSRIPITPRPCSPNGAGHASKSSSGASSPSPRGPRLTTRPWPSGASTPAIMSRRSWP